MEATLIVIKGNANKSRVLVKLPSVIGRSRAADLRVAHPMVSRQHCQLYEDNGLLKVRDLGSLNGIFVGEQKVTEAVLPPNGVFSIGPLSFRAEYEYLGAPAVAELPTPPPDKDAPKAGHSVPEEATEDSSDEVASPKLPVRTQSGIAPADGALPDFSSFAPESMDEPVARGASPTLFPAETLPELPGAMVNKDEPQPVPPPNLDLSRQAAEDEEAEEPEPTPPPNLAPGDFAGADALPEAPEAVEDDDEPQPTPPPNLGVSGQAPAEEEPDEPEPTPPPDLASEQTSSVGDADTDSDAQLELPPGAVPKSGDQSGTEAPDQDKQLGEFLKGLG
jgi:hypothetical protein